MTRVLLIDGHRASAQSLAMSCIVDGIAVRLAETLCEGVRYMMEGPVSIVLIDSALMRLSSHEQVRLFDAVAPGVPVAVLVPEGTAVEETVRLQMQGLQVVSKPFEIRDLLAKVERPARLPRARPQATSQVEALCG